MNKKINILLVSPFFFPTNTYQQELCQNITKFYPNISVTVLCYQTKKTNIKKFGNLKIYYVPCFSLIKDQFVLPNYFKLKETLNWLKNENNFNLLMCETRFFDSAWWLPNLAKKWHIPCIIVEHCASSPRHQLFVITFIAKIIDRLFIKWVLNRYNTVACSNNAVLDYLTSLGVNNLHLIDTGVDTDFFNPQKRSEVKKKFIQITYASRLVHTKGVMLFYHSVKPLLEKYPELKVVVAGNGPLYQDIKNQIETDNNQSRVELVGALAKQDMAKLYADSDIFVYPSFHHDGIANVLLEAGASGCAVISSKSGGSAELIKNGETGILLNNLSEDKICRAIESLIVDKKKRLSFGKAIRQLTIDKYNWENVSRTFFSIITKVVRSEDQLQ